MPVNSAFERHAQTVLVMLLVALLVWVGNTTQNTSLTDDEWAYALPTPSIGWPSVDSDTVNAVSVNYQVGWLDIGDMPEVLRSAVKFKMADLFTIRDTIDAGNKTQLLKVAENLCEPYVVPNY